MAAVDREILRILREHAGTRRVLFRRADTNGYVWSQRDGAKAGLRWLQRLDRFAQVVERTKGDR